MDEEETAGVFSAIAIIQTILNRRRRRHKNRKLWIHSWLAKRMHCGAYNGLLEELRLQDPAKYQNFLRMDHDSFEMLAKLVEPYIARSNTWLRQAIPARERLAVTLRFLATGESYQSLSYLYRISRQSIGKIVPETCSALYESLQKEYIKVPQTEEEWRNIARQFNIRWNFPNCIGAIDGKRIVMTAPYNSGSYYFNYKNNFSIVLLAVVDADYKFIYIDVGCNGRISDGGVFKNSELYTALSQKKLCIPSPEPVCEGDPMPMPYVLVGDDAFPLSENIMKPYSTRNLEPQKSIFNYRLSRARRISENAFGILANRFRVFLRPIQLEPDRVQMIVLAASALHNFLRRRNSSVYTPDGFLDSENPQTHEVEPGQWRLNSTHMLPLTNQASNTYSKDAKLIRDRFAAYFNSPPGAVYWQWGKN